MGGWVGRLVGASAEKKVKEAADPTRMGWCRWVGGCLGAVGRCPMEASAEGTAHSRGHAVLGWVALGSPPAVHEPLSHPHTHTPTHMHLQPLLKSYNTGAVGLHAFGLPAVQAVIGEQLALCPTCPAPAGRSSWNSRTC